MNRTKYRCAECVGRVACAAAFGAFFGAKCRLGGCDCRPFDPSRVRDTTRSAAELDAVCRSCEITQPDLIEF